MNLVFSTKNETKKPTRLFIPDPPPDLSNVIPYYYVDTIPEYRPREVILRPNSSVSFSDNIKYSMFSRAKPSGACSGCGKKKPENPFK